MRNKGWGDKNRGGGEDPERVDRVSNKTPIGFFFFFFFLPSIFSEKQLIWLRVGTGCRRVSARKLLRVYGKREERRGEDRCIQFRN